mmetsp:Transcript_20706/g.23058  ORF Transcript_20706/g.23058 Transcript_20706/m.23058 type:complete len:82 (+) Transcript_20706:155-400(+)
MLLEPEEEVDNTLVLKQGEELGAYFLKEVFGMAADVEDVVDEEDVEDVSELVGEKYGFWLGFEELQDGIAEDVEVKALLGH